MEQGPTYYFTRGPSGQLLSEWLNTGPTTATARDYVYVGSQLLSVITRTDLAPKQSAESRRQHLLDHAATGGQHLRDP